MERVFVKHKRDPRSRDKYGQNLSDETFEMKTKSMRGETVDFNRFMATHANMPALGNAGMNARGDLINAQGQVVKKREQVAMDYHRAGSKTVKRVALNGIGGEVMDPSQALQAAKDQAQAAAQKAALAAQEAASKVAGTKRRLTND